MNITQTKLEARISTNGNEIPCAVCDKFRKRTVGMTETYIARTEKWVCAECALAIDPDLAAFSYFPDRPRKLRIRLLKTYNVFDHYCGVCPECDEPGKMLNVRGSHWFICLRHGLRWCMGWNFFPEWNNQTEELWFRNHQELQRFREIDFDEFKPNLRLRPLTRIRDCLKRVSRFCTFPPKFKQPGTPKPDLTIGF